MKHKNPKFRLEKKNRVLKKKSTQNYTFELHYIPETAISKQSWTAIQRDYWDHVSM